MKTLVKMESPVTQTVEAVQQLIAYFNHGQQPEEMPSFYRLSGELVLAQSKKGDAYYVTTPHSCSCPAATYNPGKPWQAMQALHEILPSAEEGSTQRAGRSQGKPPGMAWRHEWTCGGDLNGLLPFIIAASIRQCECGS